MEDTLEPIEHVIRIQYVHDNPLDGLDDAIALAQLLVSELYGQGFQVQLISVKWEKNRNFTLLWKERPSETTGLNGMYMRADVLYSDLVNQEVIFSIHRVFFSEE